MSDSDVVLRVDVADGKYTVVQTADGYLSALRNGEPWRDLLGDKLVYSLASELKAARAAEIAAKAVQPTLRDRFAMAALVGSAAYTGLGIEDTFMAEKCERAYAYADAMMQARSARAALEVKPT